jgi:hypothetical protein
MRTSIGSQRYQGASRHAHLNRDFVLRHLNDASTVALQQNKRQSVIAEDLESHPTKQIGS